MPGWTRGLCRDAVTSSRPPSCASPGRLFPTLTLDDPLPFFRPHVHATTTAIKSSTGDGLVRALQHVPQVYFQDDFSLAKLDLAANIWDFADEDINGRVDELTKYLTVVETQLLKEISARSAPFFEAANNLHELRSVLADCLSRVANLRAAMTAMDESTYKAAVTVTTLQRRRKHLAATMAQLRGLEEVVASQGALQCLLDAQDYAGALEVLESMKHLVDTQLNSGLITFSNLPPQLAQTTNVVENLLGVEFLTAAHDNELPQLVERLAHMTLKRSSALAAAAANGGGSTSSGGAPPQRHVSTSEWIEPTMETLMEEVASNNAAAREQLYDRLLPLVMGLHRAGRLPGVLEQYKDNASNNIKNLIMSVVERIVPLLGDSTVAMYNSGGSGSSGGDGSSSSSEQLRYLQHEEFLVLLLVLQHVVAGCLSQIGLVTQMVEEILRGMRTPAAQIGALQRDLRAAQQASLEVAQAR